MRTRLIPYGALSIAFLAGCGTLNSARPLDKGEHVVGLTVGGPLIDVGFAKLALPSAVLQGRSGVATLAGRPVDVDYGLHLTPMVFGMTGVHGGVSWLAMDQDGGVPALALTQRLFFYDNHLDGTLPKVQRASYFIDQVELTASWDTPTALIYTGVGDYLDFREPSLLLTPFVGSDFHLGKGWGLQVELRHYAINKKNPQRSLDWITWGPGALGTTLSVSRQLGGAK